MDDGERSLRESPFAVGLIPSPFPFADSREITSERSARSLLSLAALFPSGCRLLSAALRRSLSFWRSLSSRALSRSAMRSALSLSGIKDLRIPRGSSTMDILLLVDEEDLSRPSSSRPSIDVET